MDRKDDGVSVCAVLLTNDGNTVQRIVRTRRFKWETEPKKIQSTWIEMVWRSLTSAHATHRYTKSTSLFAQPFLWPYYPIGMRSRLYKIDCVARTHRITEPPRSLYSKVICDSAVSCASTINKKTRFSVALIASTEKPSRKHLLNGPMCVATVTVSQHSNTHSFGTI